MFGLCAFFFLNQWNGGIVAVLDGKEGALCVSVTPPKALKTAGDRKKDETELLTAVFQTYDNSEHCEVTAGGAGDHFSCSRAGMLMFQPMACRSKPQVNRLQVMLSSHQAEQQTMRR